MVISLFLRKTFSIHTDIVYLKGESVPQEMYEFVESPNVLILYSENGFAVYAQL